MHLTGSKFLAFRHGDLDTDCYLLDVAYEEG